MTLEFCRKTFEKCSNIKFHETASSGSRLVPFGRTDRRTDNTKLIVAFRKFANVLMKNSVLAKIRYMFRPKWSSSGEAVTKSYKARQNQKSF